MKMQKRGFTIIELMVVIVILGIVFGMSIPIFNNKQAKFNSNYSNFIDLLNVARQTAISTGENISVSIIDTGLIIGGKEPLYFYHGITVANASTIPDTIYFLPNGSPDVISSSMGDILISGFGYSRHIYVAASGYIISE